MDLPATTTDVLGQPTRARLFALLTELKRPAGTDELAGLVELHPNGVRAHLERLRAAGLVDRARAARPRGRPRDEWTVAARAQPGGDPPNAYRDLVRWLARAAPAGAAPTRHIEATGREIGQDIAPTATRATAPALRDALAALGFQPEVEEAGGAIVCELGNCPYRDAVRENQPAICALHRGITLGLLDVIDPDAELTGFTPRDPDSAGCLIVVRAGAPAGADEEKRR